MKARYNGKPLKLVAKVKTRPDGATGFVTRNGLLRLKRGGNTRIDVFFKDREARGYTFVQRRTFLSTFLSYEGAIGEPKPEETNSDVRKLIIEYQALEGKALERAELWCVDENLSVKSIRFMGFDLKEDSIVFCRYFGGQEQIHSIPLRLLESK